MRQPAARAVEADRGIEELGELRVQVAAADLHVPVLGRLRMQFELEALDLRGAHVLQIRQQAEGRRARNQHLLILVIHEKAGDVERQPAVEEQPL